MSEESKEGYPFRETPQPAGEGFSGTNATYLQLEGAPHKVVREEKHPRAKEKSRTAEQEVLEAEEKRIRAVKETLYDLKERGIHIPAFHFVVGQDDEGTRKSFIVTDVIQGENMSEIEAAGKLAPLARAVDTIFATILRAMRERYEQGKPYYWDVKLKNMVHYPAKGGSREDLIYLVDIGKESFKVPGTDDTWNLFYLKGAMTGISVELQRLCASHPPSAEIRREFEGLHDVIQRKDSRWNSFRKTHGFFLPS